MERSTKPMNPSQGPTVLRIGIAVLFLWAGATKAMDPASFAFAIDNYRLLPWPLTAGFALYLPWLEIVAAVAVLPRRTRSGALAILTGMCALFVIALGSALIRGLDISCGCFGADSNGGTGLSLLRATLLLLACAILLMTERKAMQPTQAFKT